MTTTPPSTPPMPSPPAQPRRSSLLWWVLGLIGAGVVILGLGGVLIALYLARQVEAVRTGPEGVELRTPMGGLNVEKGGKAATGLPEYPGARQTEPAAAVEIAGPDEEAFVVTAAKYRAPQPVAVVDDWYREQLGPDFEREPAGTMLRKKRIFGAEVRSDDIAYISERNDVVRFVVLRSHRTETEIVLARLGKRELQ